jgi:L-iditol 2-dehydrogenase
LAYAVLLYLPAVLKFDIYLMQTTGEERSMGELKSKSLLFDAPGIMTTVSRTVPSPQHGQVLVRMKACGICLYDIKNWKGYVHDEDYCANPGHEGVGIVEQVGEGATGFSPGDKVSSAQFGGAFSEYFVAEAGNLAKIPESVDHYEQWIAEPATCAVNGVRLSKIEPGDDVVIIGCGYMGTLIMQIMPKEYLANLIVVDIDEKKLRRAERYGATATVNAGSSDPVRTVLDLIGKEADIVIEATGAAGTIVQATAMVKIGGRLTIFGHHKEDEGAPVSTWHLKGLEVLNTSPFLSRSFQKDLADAVKLMRAGKFDQGELITHLYTFDRIETAFQEVFERPEGLIKAVVVDGQG